MFRDQYQSFVRERQLQTTEVSHVCLSNCLSERASWHSLRLMLLKLCLFSPMLPSRATRMIVNRNVVDKNCI